MNKTDLVDKQYLRGDIPPFRPGDTVKVHVRVVEAGRERVQVFQGVVIRRQGGGLQETFTVRKISFGVGVERTFPVHSPSIAKLEVVSRGKVRRAKLYYLRERKGRKARIRERRVEGEELAALQAFEARSAGEGEETEEREEASEVPEAESETGPAADVEGTPTNEIPEVMEAETGDGSAPEVAATVAEAEGRA